MLSLVFLLSVAAAPSLAQPLTGAAPAKSGASTGTTVPPWRVEGDTIEECWVIEYLPFTEAGTNCGFANDYEEMCPYGSNSPDVVYSYSPPYDMCISISLCDSYYDTKMFVYEDELTPGSPVACNDDSYDCVDPPVAYTSLIEQLEIYAGHTYYIVVDGYNGQCGDYVLLVEEVYCGPECEIECVGTPEGEPVCYDNYADQYNGGCQSDTWSYIEAGHESIEYCGQGGVYDYNGLSYRDTDWYLIYPCGDVPISFTIDAEFDALLALVTGVPDCWDPVILSYVNAPECIPTTLTVTLPMEPVGVFVATSTWDPDFECGSDYVLTVEGYTEHCDPTPVENTTWGQVKALYR
jgi:hypothetical protein